MQCKVHIQSNQARGLESDFASFSISVTLSVTEAELFAECEYAQDMIQINQNVMSLGLKVKTPIKLYMDNHGVVDLVNMLSVGVILVMGMFNTGGSGI